MAQCDGMRISFKASDDCFDKSIFTVDSFDKDLKDIFNYASKYEDRFPVLYSIDYWGHTFVQQINELKNELNMLSNAEPDTQDQVSDLIAFIDKCMKLENVGHCTFLFNK